MEALDRGPDSFGDNDMVVIRYDSPCGAPGMPELLDPDVATLRLSCRQRQQITAPR